MSVEIGKVFELNPGIDFLIETRSQETFQTLNLNCVCELPREA